MPSSQPTFIRETGIVLVWAAAAANVFIYTAKAFRSTYGNDIGIDGTSDINASGATVSKQTPNKQISAAVKGQGNINRQSAVAQAVVAADTAATGSARLGVAAANIQAKSGGTWFAPAQAAKSVGDWIAGLFGG